MAAEDQGWGPWRPKAGLPGVPWERCGLSGQPVPVGLTPLHGGVVKSPCQKAMDDKHSNRKYITEIGLKDVRSEIQMPLTE